MVTYVTICFIAGIVPLFSIPAHAIVAGGDAASPELSPGIALAHLSHTWYSAGGLGQQSAFQWPLLFPFVTLDLALAKLGFSYTVINHLWFVVLFAAQAGFSYWLFREIFPEYADSPGALVAPLVIILNPFTFIVYHSPYPTTNLAIAVFPGMVAAVLATARQRSFTHLAIFLALCAVSTAGDVNYAITLVEGLGMLAAWLYLFYARRSSTAVATFLIFLGCHVILSIAHLHGIQTSFSAIVADSVQYSRDTINAVSQFSTADRSWRLIGGYLFSNNVGGHPFIVQHALYTSNPAFIVATWIIPLLALIGASAVVVPRLRARLMFVLPVLVLALIMVKGTSGIGGTGLGWLVTHVPLFEAFRDPFSKFAWLLALIYALFAALAVALLLRATRSVPLRWGLLVTVAVSCALSGWPIISGGLFWQQAIVRVPKTYFHIAALINRDPTEARVAEMPVAPIGFDAYRWGYVGAGLNSNLIRPPLLSREFDFGSPGNAALDDTLQNANEIIGAAHIASVLGFYGFGYVLSDTSFLPSYYSSGLSSELLRLPASGMQVKARDGDETLVQIEPALLNPRAYVATRAIIGVNSIADVSAACFLVRSCPGAAFIPDAIEPIFAGDVDRLVYPTAKVRQPLAAIYAYRRSPFLRAAAPRAMAMQGRELWFLDFANVTVGRPGAGLSADPVLLRGVPMSRLAVTLGSSLPAAFMTIASVPRHLEHVDRFTALCPREGKSRSETMPIPDNSDTSRPFLLVLRYISSSNPISLVLVGTDPDRHAVYDLAAARGIASFTRLVRLTHTSQIEVIAGGGRAVPCPQVQMLLAQGSLPAGTALFDNLNAFDATPLYYSRKAAYYLPAWRHQPRTDGPLVDPTMTLQWSQPEPVDPLAKNPRNVRLVVRQGRAPAALSFQTTNAYTDVHAAALHLVPGAAYQLSVRLRTSSTAPLMLGAVSIGGASLKRIVIPNTPALQTIRMRFRVPETASDCVLYFYFGDLSGRRHVIDISEPNLSRVSPPRTVSLVLGDRLPQPSAMRVTKAGPESWRVHVVDAPPHYLLILNSTYHPDWQVLGAPATHFIANLFENGWVINRAGSYDLIIQFASSRYLLIGVVSGTALMVLGLLIFGVWRYSRRSAHSAERSQSVSERSV